MTDFNKQSERLSVIAAIGQGQFSQIKYLFDENEELENRLVELEGKSGSAQGHVHSKLDDIEPVKELAFDAKVVDIRESLIELQGRFNDILNALKGELNV